MPRRTCIGESAGGSAIARPRQPRGITVAAASGMTRTSAFVLVALVVAACDGSGSTSPTAPTLVSNGIFSPPATPTPTVTPAPTPTVPGTVPAQPPAPTGSTISAPAPVTTPVPSLITAPAPSQPPGTTMPVPTNPLAPPTSASPPAAGAPAGTGSSTITAPAPKP